MLPIEAFAEAVAFLRLFDLKALLVANAVSSTLAAKAANSIRREEFPGLLFHIDNRWIEVYRRAGVPVDGASSHWPFVAQLEFTNENETIEFVAAAFPNCIFENLDISGFISERLIDAIGRAADSVVVNRVHYLPSHTSPDHFLTFIRKFRKVKAVQIHGEVSDDDVNEIAKLLRGSGVQELWYDSSDEDLAPNKVSIF